MRPLDTLIAHKVLNLMPELSGTDKRVAGALIDHFNRKTGQCDPSLNRIAKLLGICRRTVIRSMHHLEASGLFRKRRHGGNLHRNSYEPVWARFREREAAWNIRFRAKSTPSPTTELSPYPCQPCHVGGDAAVTQTLPMNPSKETCLPISERSGHGSPTRQRGKEERGCRAKQDDAPPFPSQGRDGGSLRVARGAAERRWNCALYEHYRSRTDIYGAVIEAVDAEMQSAATAAELRKHGAGFAYILDQLSVRIPSLVTPIDGGNHRPSQEKK